MRAPSAATRATSADAHDIAWTNASRAGSATAVPAWIAAPSDSRAAASTGAGTPSGTPAASCARELGDNLSVYEAERLRRAT